MQQLDGDNSHHVEICPMLGRGKRAHDEFKSSLVHAIRESGVASDARTEVRLSAHGVDGTRVSYDSDAVYFEPDGRKVVVLI